ncbi:MAG: precorrin-6A reductase [Candidatus Heteroscillospira sp.]|jgi:precorrin-6A/cobalt-precorrin-6A reductase
MRVLLFGGTSEGRVLASRLRDEGIDHLVCVATEYGAELLPEGVKSHTGRLDAEAMKALMRGGFDCVVDATHPYAAEVTKNIRAAAGEAGLNYLRLLRESDAEDGCIKAQNMAEAAQLLRNMPGNVLLTTGSKELAPFAVPGLLERCCPRVLPTADSLEKCLSLGFPPAHIICMQGPFTREMNMATIGQFDIKVLLTKDSGGYGGFRDKAEAARECGCALLVVERPTEETGYSMEQVMDYIREVGA